jgi:uncharacterized phage-associated protein
MTDADRLPDAMHVVIQEAQDHGLDLGAVKLCKIMVFADAMALYNLLPPVTGRPIIKAQFGPVPKGYREVWRWLEEQGRVRVSPQKARFEYTRFVSMGKPDLSVFSPVELKILKTLTHEFCNNFSAIQLSDLTHNRIYDLVEMDEEIPVTAYLPHFSIPKSPEELREHVDGLVSQGYSLDGDLTHDHDS